MIVIGRNGKDIPEEQALDFVAAYTVGNDVSARDWQREPGKAGPVPQWSFSKSFDDHAPLGPCLVRQQELDAATNLYLRRPSWRPASVSRCHSPFYHGR